MFFSARSKKVRDEKKLTMPRVQEVHIISSRFHTHGSLETTTLSKLIEAIIKSLSKVKITIDEYTYVPNLNQVLI